MVKLQNRGQFCYVKSVKFTDKKKKMLVHSRTQYYWNEGVRYVFESVDFIGLK